MRGGPFVTSRSPKFGTTLHNQICVIFIARLENYIYSSINLNETNFMVLSIVHN